MEIGDLHLAGFADKRKILKCLYRVGYNACTEIADVELWGYWMSANTYSYAYWTGNFRIGEVGWE